MDPWPQSVPCPKPRPGGRPCGQLRAVGWRRDGPPHHYVCNRCYAIWSSEHVRALVKARAHVAEIREEMAGDRPEQATLPGLEG